MSSITTFFRHCPSCGRRFEIRLTGRKSVEAESEIRAGRSAEDRTFRASEPAVVADSQSTKSYHILSHDTSPLTVVTEEFLYSYKCNHCGHQWSEERFRTGTERTSPEYRGD